VTWTLYSGAAALSSLVLLCSVVSCRCCLSYCLVLICSYLLYSFIVPSPVLLRPVLFCLHIPASAFGMSIVGYIIMMSISQMTHLSFRKMSWVALRAEDIIFDRTTACILNYCIIDVSVILIAKNAQFTSTADHSNLLSLIGKQQGSWTVRCYPCT
jgi:hypothetical protein